VAGSIYSLSILGKRRVVISSVELLNEVCDEKRFGKVVTAALNEVRNATGDGLFTAVSSCRRKSLEYVYLI
jgi:cytochrome P450/NADPH-cytochrome P450 reductase